MALLLNKKKKNLDILTNKMQNDFISTLFSKENKNEHTIDYEELRFSINDVHDDIMLMYKHLGVITLSFYLSFFFCVCFFYFLGEQFLANKKICVFLGMVAFIWISNNRMLHWFSHKKLFNLNKFRNENQILTNTFLNKNNSFFINNIKEDLYSNLFLYDKSLNKQELYQKISQDIKNIDIEFEILIYNLKINENRKTYTPHAFNKFINYIEEIYLNIENIKEE